jgi:phosphoserine phosphatase RsbU/P
VVVAALVWILIVKLRDGTGGRDFAVMRWGLICFVALAVWDNTLGPSWFGFTLEPYGFAVFLGSLGYVAAGRILHRDEELARIQNELALAQRIQLSILPAAFPESKHFRVAARYEPMTSVAGDFYDFTLADDQHAGLLIADVSGHGVPAALIASMVKMAASSQRANADQPAELLAGMNAALCGHTQDQFVTAAYVHLDAATRELRYAAAGHPPMFLLRGGEVKEIAENGLLLAATSAASYAQIALPVEPGDRLLLYTDGVVEARNGQGKMFGEASLIDAFRQTAALPPADAAGRIVAEVQQWAKSQDDDLTLLICDYLGPAEAVPA